MRCFFISLILLAACENRVNVHTTPAPPPAPAATSGPGGGDGVSTGWPGPIIAYYRVYDALPKLLSKCAVFCQLAPSTHARLEGVRDLLASIEGDGESIISMFSKENGVLVYAEGRHRLWVNPRDVFNDKYEMEFVRLIESLLRPLLAYRYPESSASSLWFETAAVADEMTARFDQIFDEPLADTLADYFPRILRNRI